MLATDGPLSSDRIAEVRSAILRYRKDTGISNRDLAGLAGLSEGTISQFLSNRYPGDNSEVARKVNNGMERDARRRAAKLPKDYIVTRAAETMAAFIQLVDKLCCMLAIIADSGAGKTRVLRYWCDKTNGIFVTCTPGMRPRHIYGKIADILGINRERRTTTMELLDLIVEKLAGSKRILYVDEANLLATHIGCLRPIFDLAKTPIVMAGTCEILNKIDADRNHGAGQMSSRCLRCDLTKITAQELGKSGRRAQRCSSPCRRSPSFLK